MNFEIFKKPSYECKICHKKYKTNWINRHMVKNHGWKYQDGVNASPMVQLSELSNCHNAPVKVAGSDEGTNFYYCTVCNNPCDLAPKPSEDKLEKIFMEPLAQLTARAMDKDGYEAYKDFYSFLRNYIAQSEQQARREALQSIKHDLES